MSPRAYLFDYGGTLDGEGWHWFDRFLHLYREAGSALPETRIKDAFYGADHEIGPEAAARGYRLRPLLERHVELQEKIAGPFDPGFARRLVEGFETITEIGWRRARAVLARLRGSGLRLGVVSNFYGNLDVLLEESGLAPFLEVVIESVKVGFEKPDPRIYRAALARLGLPPRDVVMVGDNCDRDCRVAKDLGMGTVWLRRSDALAPGVADRVIRELAEL